MRGTANLFLPHIWDALGGDASLPALVRFEQPGALASAFRVTDLAAGAVAAAGLAVSELAAASGQLPAALVVDRRLASFWFQWSLRPSGWALPPVWDPIAGDYRTRDGWIRLHTNAPHHRQAAQSVLGPYDDRTAMAEAVKLWGKQALEDAVVAAGGCAAQMRSLAEWESHPQGMAVAAEPLVAVEEGSRIGRAGRSPRPGRPLAGLKVLDLTRVLAGPVATRFLAGYGAEVLRLDPPDWDEPAVVPEVTLGKRCTRLDLTNAVDRTLFEALLSEADILVHGYRNGALDGLGYDAARRQALSPGLIDVGLDAYGWTGPWQGRRGFDSLVQMSCGIADAGRAWKQSEAPVPLPVQALDHATGYLMAAAAVRAVTRRRETGKGSRTKLSLARVAALLVGAGRQEEEPSFAAETPADRAEAIERTPWGKAQRLRPPLAIEDMPMQWDRPAAALGSAEPAWAA